MNGKSPGVHTTVTPHGRHRYQLPPFTSVVKVWFLSSGGGSWWCLRCRCCRSGSSFSGGVGGVVDRSGISPNNSRTILDLFWFDTTQQNKMTGETKHRTMYTLECPVALFFIYVGHKAEGDDLLGPNGPRLDTPGVKDGKDGRSL